MNLKDKVYLNDEGWWWPKDDIKGHGGAWFDLFGAFAETPEKISALVPNRKVVVQAGGNCGLYVKRYANLFEQVYTFEPDPLNFYCLNLNVTEGNVHKFQAALGFHRKCLSVESDPIPYNVGAVHVGDNGNIPTLRVDDLGLEHCNLIQLDIEGFELHALLGAQETIKRCKPVLVLEFGWEHRYNISGRDIDNFIRSLNYRLVGPLLGGQGDYVYMPIDN